MVVLVEYVHLYDPFNGPFTSVDQLKAALNVFRSGFDTVKQKAIGWGVYAPFQQGGVEEEVQQFIAQVEAEIRSLGG